MRGKTGTRACSKCGAEKSLFVVIRHEKICGLPSRIKVNPRAGLRGKWSKGLTAATDVRVKINRDAAVAGKMRYLSTLSSAQKKAKYGAPRDWSNCGGCRDGSGRGRKGWYSGYRCDSSWELAWIIYAIDHGIAFTRNATPYQYYFDGKNRRFYPDFRLESGSLIEIKGYLDPKNEAKIAAVPGLTVIGKKEIAPYVVYATEKFGADFVSVAYGNKPTYRCADCDASVNRGYDRCRTCARRKSVRYKIEWPHADEIRCLLLAHRYYSRVGKLLGVSGHAVQKRMKKFGHQDNLVKSAV